MFIVIEAILFYDYLLTVAREIEHVWNRARFSLAAFLFFINRYLSLFGTIIVVLEYFQHHSPHVSYLTPSHFLWLIMRMRQRCAPFNDA